MNCQIRGLTSIRKGLGKDETPLLVNSNSIKASEIVSGRVSGENLKKYPRGYFYKPGRVPIRRGPNFANPEGSHFCQSGGVPILPIRRGPIFTNPEASFFLPIRRGPIFANPEGSLFLPIRRGPIFANPEGSHFCQTGGVPFLSIRRGIILARLKKTTEKKVVKGTRLLGDRLGTSDCTGNLPFIKNQTKTKQV